LNDLAAQLCPKWGSGPQFACQCVFAEVLLVDILFDAEREYEDREFKDLTVHGEEIGFKEFRECVFVGCSFREAVFRACRFHTCLFRQCDLSIVRVRDCGFTNTTFEDSKAVGINWAEADWPRGKSLLASIDFFNCAVSYSTFIGLRLPRINITRCVARDVDFSGADLTRANCTHTDFSDSRFLNTNLTEADFTGATNYSINANLNVLKKTRFSFPEAMALLDSLDIVLTE
jgi:fluoroquinolone resistance protein